MPDTVDWAERETWFLGQLGAQSPDFGELTETLRQLIEAGEEERAGPLGELLFDSLRESKDTERTIEVLRLLSSREPQGKEERRRLVQTLLDVLGSGPEQRAIVSEAGFDEDVETDECFRRLMLLRALAPGVLCHDRTWGVGVVRKTDWFYKRLMIDFENKQGHEMSFSYASQSLEVLDKDHLLARWHSDPDGMRALCVQNPAEVVRVALRSFGPLSAVSLQEQLSPRIVGESQWKSFWTAARKALKADPLVEVPARRADPLHLLDKEKTYDRTWFRAFAHERDASRILEQIAALLDNRGPESLTPGEREVLAERLAFVVRGSRHGRPEHCARAILAATEAGIEDENLPLAALLDTYLEPRALEKTLVDLPAREVARFLDRLWTHQPVPAGDLLLALLPEQQTSILNESIDRLVRGGREKEVADVLRRLVEEQKAGPFVLYWMHRHPEACKDWSLGSLPDRARLMLRAMAIPAAGETLKTQNQLRVLFTQRKWVAEVLAGMSPRERGEMMRTIRDSDFWSVLEQRSVLAAMVKACPELEEIMKEQRVKAAAPKARTATTSERSYRQRQDQLRRIVEVDIPEVAREIGVAREHGDLRENFEYQAAKDKQALLLRRQSELEAMLRDVRPSDYATSYAPADRVAQGSGVLLERADGGREQYYILGVWDRDEQLGIISSESSMAQALMGRRAGDEVKPESGNTYRILDVTPLSAEVRTWINGA